MIKTVAYEVSAWVDDEEFTRHYYFADHSECVFFLCKYYPRFKKLCVKRLRVDTELHELCYDEIKYCHALRSFC